MARVTGPLGSQQASGTVANLLTYATTNGRQYVKRKSQPTDARTPDQLTARLVLAFLAQSWKNAVTDADKATWAALAAQTNVTLPNAFTAENLRRQTQFAAPTQNLGLVGTSVAADWTTAPQGTVLPNAIRVNWNILNLNDLWGLWTAKLPFPGFPDETTPLSALTLITATGPGQVTIIDQPTGSWEYMYWEVSKYDRDAGLQNFQHLTIL